MRKKKLSTKIISGLLAVVMVFLMIPFSAISISAASTPKPMTPLQEYRAKTTQSLDQITKYINDREAEDAKLKNSFGNNIKKINTFSKGVGTAINTALMIYNTIDEDASWGENIGNIALNLVCSYIGVQLPGQESEAEIIIREIEKMLDEVNSRIDAVNENIDALAEQVDQNTANLASYMWSLNQFDNDMDVLNEFTQGSNPNAYSYYTDREKLYAAYSELMLLLDSGTATSDNIKDAYDKLYIEAIKSEQLYQYMTGENNKLTNQKSIQEALYDYSVLSIYLCSQGEVQDENGNLENIEIKCIEFAEDLYSTYIFSNYALMICYNYQIEYLSTHNSDALTTYYDVEGIEGKNDILGASIFGYYNVSGKVPAMLKKQEIINEEIVSYIAYVLNLEGSYLYENGANVGKDTIYTIPYKEIFDIESHNTEEYSVTYGSFSPITKHVRTNNKVAHGDTLYMNVLPNDLASLFASGNFTFTTSDETIATVNNAGIVNVIGTSGTFLISMKYNDVIIYSLEFTIEDGLYSGGMGIEDCPYFLSEWSDIAILSSTAKHYQSKNIYFELTNDIDGGGNTFSGIPNFHGTLNGADYRLYHFSYISSEVYNGFVQKLAIEGTIKNLIIGHYENQYDDYNNYAVSFVCNVGTWEPSIGAICGYNEGTVENCSGEFINVKITNYLDVGNGNTLYSNAGGLIGINQGTVRNCSVAYSNITSEAKTEYDNSAPMCWARSGGIVGFNYGEVSNSISYSNCITGYAESADKGSGKADGAYSFCGGITGVLYCAPATVISSYEKSNVYNASVKTDGGSGAYSGAFYGAYHVNQYGVSSNKDVTVDCIKDSLGDWVIDGETGCPTRASLEYVPEINAGAGSYTDVLEYVKGEKHLKYAYTTGGNPEYSTTTIHEYEMSVGRIDTSVCGVQTVVKLIAEEGTSLYRKEILNVNIVSETPTELCVYTSPNKLEYDRFDTSIEYTGLQLVLLYNNGTTKFLNDGSEPNTTKEFTEEFDFSNVGSTDITFLCEGLSAKVSVNVNPCTHKNTRNDSQIDATCTDVGYTAAVFCLDCQIYVDGHDMIPIIEHTWDTGVITEEPTHLNDGVITYTCIVENCDATKTTVIGQITEHSFGVWSKHDDNQHVHECECGEKEYADHTWNSGVVTQPATHLAVGSKLYTCMACSATKTEVIPKPTAHSFGTWSKHDDHQHVHECECGITEYENHNWVNETVTVQPTYSTTGTKTYTCSVCNAVKSEEIPPLEIPANAPYIVVDSKNAVVGETVTVNIRLQNNPGITSMKFNVQYDSMLLKLTNIKYNTAMGGQSVMPENINNINGYLVLYWTDGFSNFDEDGVFATLTFNVSEDAVIDTTTSIIVTYDAEDIYDAEESNITYFCENGVLTFINYIPGDINGDGVVNTKDTTRLMRYLANWDVEVNEATLDVNGDGVVNTKDTTRLMRYLAGWDVDIY